MKKTEAIESFPTTEEIKEVFTGDWDRKFNLPELSKEEPTTTLLLIKIKILVVLVKIWAKS